ncbi:MAG TPA: aminotransferase class IV [Opitutaceae bacterium]|jgi:branched-chain amino acid aminotransferase|nr:aminotransferase class IV [Opitutaceae bacterium]
MHIQANTNGRLHPATEPSLSPLNRGFLYGDAIYEVWRTYHGVLFAWTEHWERLERSARALYLTIPLPADKLREEIRRTVAAYRAAGGAGEDLYVRLQATRGAGAIGLDVALADRPDYVLLVQPCPRLSAEHLARGQKLSVARGLRRNPVDAMNPAWKTGNYLNNLLCLREAKERGADEVVILNQAGEVTEAAVSNLAFVRGGKLITPPLSAGILEGVTRRLILGGIAAAAGLEAVEATVRPEDFGTCEECMLLSTTKDVVPVAAIDQAAFRVAPDTAAMRLKAAFAAYARRYADRHPEGRVL